MEEIMSRTAHVYRVIIIGNKQSPSPQQGARGGFNFAF